MGWIWNFHHLCLCCAATQEWLQWFMHSLSEFPVQRHGSYWRRLYTNMAGWCQMMLKPVLKFVALARKKTERYVVPTDGSHLCPRHPVSGPSNSWHCTCLGHSTTTYFTSLTFVVWTALVSISTSADLKLASEYTYHTKLQPKRATPPAHYHRDQRVHDVIHPFVLDEGSKACPYGNQALRFSSGGKLVQLMMALVLPLFRPGYFMLLYMASD